MYQDYTPFVNVSGIYFEQIDYYGHNEGAASFKVKQSILEMNKQFERLRDELVSRDMVDDVNIMVFSDHGMANVVPNRCIWLNEYIDVTDTITILATGTMASFWTYPGTTKQVLYSGEISTRELFTCRPTAYGTYNVTQINAI